MPNVRISEKAKTLLNHAQRFHTVFDGTPSTFGELVERAMKSWLGDVLKYSQEEPEYSPLIKEVARESYEILEPIFTEE